MSSRCQLQTYAGPRSAAFTRTHTVIFVFNHNLCGRQKAPAGEKSTQHCIQRGHVTVKGCGEEREDGEGGMEREGGTGGSTRLLHY